MTTSVKTKDDLILLLKRYNIPFETWGTGKSKTLNHLFSEVLSGESRMEENNIPSESKQIFPLVRNVASACVDIFYEEAGVRYKLVEEKQIFADGRERRRNLKTSIAEKILPGEDPTDAAHRGLKTEISAALDPIDLAPKGLVARAPAPSESFPGLMSRRTVYHYGMTMPEEFYRPEGYMEKQEDKITYFVWKKIS